MKKCHQKITYQSIYLTSSNNLSMSNAGKSPLLSSECLEVNKTSVLFRILPFWTSNWFSETISKNKN